MTTTPSAKCGRNFAGRVRRFFASSFWTYSPSSTGSLSHFAPLYPTIPHIAITTVHAATAPRPSGRIQAAAGRTAFASSGKVSTETIAAPTSAVAV